MSGAHVRQAPIEPFALSRVPHFSRSLRKVGLFVSRASRLGNSSRDLKARVLYSYLHMARNPVPNNTQDRVLLLSRRRCCICFGLNGDLALKQGQIAHLDRDNTNDDLDNLAFVCLPHHDQYDSKTSQSKGLREGEVKRFRKELYDRIVAGLPGEAASKGGEDHPTNTLNMKVSPTLSPAFSKTDEQAPARSREITGRGEILPNVGSLRPEIRHITHDDESDVWLRNNLTEGEMGDFLAALLPFSNDPQPGKKTLPIEGLRARMTYYRGDEVHEFKRVDSGCWLGEAYRFIELEVGGIVYLIAAIVVNGHGGFIENPRYLLARYDKDSTSVDHLPNGRYELKVALMGGAHGEYSEEYWFELEVGEELKCKRINPFPVR